MTPLPMNPLPTKSRPNERLRRQRKGRCWTLQEAAGRLYHLCFQEDEACPWISADQMGRWERGVLPQQKYQAKLCTLYQQGPEALGFLEPSRPQRPGMAPSLVRGRVDGSAAAVLLYRALLHPFACFSPDELPEEETRVSSLSSSASPSLRSLRLLRGWSQARVAEEIGTFEKTVSRWECGEQKPSPHYRERLCLLFQTTADQLGLL